MALPADFSPWEHLQQVVRLVHNRIVKEEFADLGDDSWDEDITIPRGSLRIACTMLDNDTAEMTLIRMHLFYLSLRKAQDMQAPMVGIPLDSFQESRKYKPQIMLYFQEDWQDVDPNYQPVKGIITIRLMNQESTSITNAEVVGWANKIKSSFGTGTGFVWRKGKEMSSYLEKDKGYQLQLLVRDEAEGKKVVEQVLDIQGHSPDWSNFQHKINENPTMAYPTIPGNQTILGKTYKKPRKRPIADVRFQYAALNVHGFPKPIILYDRTGYYTKTIVPT